MLGWIDHVETCSIARHKPTRDNARYKHDELNEMVVSLLLIILFLAVGASVR